MFDAGQSQTLSVMKSSNLESQLEMLFALKREEKPPVNFIRDFLAEFHRRIQKSNLKLRPPAPEIKRGSA